MEARFGVGLGGVRIHADAQAANSARAHHARAYTVGQRIVFAAGQHQPATEAGQRLLAHELAHTIQNRRADPGPRRTAQDTSDDPAEREAGRAAGSVRDGGRFAISAGPAAAVARDPDGTEPTGAEIADKVIEKEDFHDPEASGGVGDFPAAFRILQPLATAKLLDTLDEVDKRAHLELLQAHKGEADPQDQDRLLAAILAVLYRNRGLEASDLGRAPTLVASLSTGDQTTIGNFLKSASEHKFEVFFHGQPAEIARLAKLQAAAWEEKRKQLEEQKKKEAEEAAKKANEEAKKRGAPPPPPPAAPKVELKDVVQQQVQSLAFPTKPTDAWTKLPEADKKDWTDKRAPAAWDKVKASVKGMELETVIAKSKGYKFDPEPMLKNGWYAFESGGFMNFGMQFVKDVEADPKNVWPNVAHELGGHFEYGPTYAKRVSEKALEALPEADRKTFQEGEGFKQFFKAYQYAETEIFSALRERRYAVPESGPAPIYGGLKPDANIETRLNDLEKAFPRPVVQAVLTELKMRVDASSLILERDKLYFVAQIKKHGFTP
jgi:hypothetical protein